MRLPVLPEFDPADDDADTGRPWYADGLHFQCTCCGNCCTGPPGYVWVTDAEIDKLAAHVGRPVEEFRKLHVRTVGGRFSLKERRNERGEYDCVFLKPLPGDTRQKRLRGCGVYESRPLQCRTWPFWDGLLESRDAWEHSKETCPGMDTGKAYEFDHIERMRTADEWPDNPPTSKSD